MSDLTSFTPSAQSAFDAIRHTRSDGTEYWLARELMPLLGYDRWQNFAAAIDRSMSTAQNQGHHVATEFAQVSQVTDAGNLGKQARGEYELSRFAAYLVAMNGDPRKPAVAAAQAYFAVKTREAEVRETREISGPELMARAVLEANRTIKALEATVSEQQPKVEAWDHIVSSAGSWSYEEAAKVLFEQGIVKIGQQRLVARLVEWGYLYRDTKKRPHVYQRYIEQGLFVTKARVYTDQETGEIRASSAPQVRISGKGLDLLFRRFRYGQMALPVGAAR